MEFREYRENQRGHNLQETVYRDRANDETAWAEPIHS